MSSKRIYVKYFVNEPAAVDLPEIVPIFHHWIQQKSVEGLLIDVADYKHVYQGPGIILIGHEGDYALDTTSGRAGFQYTFKREFADTLRDNIRTAFRLALQGANQLEVEPSLKGQVTFAATEAQLVLADALATPNTAEGYAAVAEDVYAVAAELYGEDVVIAQVENDPREHLTIRVIAPQANGVGELAQRLN